MDVEHSVPLNNETVLGKEFSISQNFAILDDQLLGVYDEPHYESIVDIS